MKYIRYVLPAVIISPFSLLYLQEFFIRNFLQVSMMSNVLYFSVGIIIAFIVFFFVGIRDRDQWGRKLIVFLLAFCAGQLLTFWYMLTTFTLKF